MSKIDFDVCVEEIGLSISTDSSVEISTSKDRGFQGPKGDKGEPGKDGANIDILGAYESEEAMNEAHPTGKQGEACTIKGDLYAWNVQSGRWINVGRFQGPKGDKGEQGEKGVQGERGADGVHGKDGVDGLTVEVTMDGVTYTQIDGNITLPLQTVTTQQIDDIVKPLIPESPKTKPNNYWNKQQSDDRYLTKGTDLNAQLQPIIDDKISKGILQNMTIIDGSLTKEKFTSDVVNDINTIKPTNKEIKDARVSTFGEEFEHLGDRIDTEVKRLINKIEITETSKTGATDYKIDNTVEGTTVNPVVKGRTLQNLCNKIPRSCSPNSSYSDGVYTIQAKETNFNGIYFDGLTQSNKIYTVSMNVLSLIQGDGSTIKVQVNDGGYQYASTFTLGVNKFTINVKEVGKINDIRILRIKHNPSDTGEFKFKDFMLLEGDWTDKEIPPYFEGIKSVGEEDGNKIEILSCGKNLFDINDCVPHVGNGYEMKLEDNKITMIGKYYADREIYSSIEYGAKVFLEKGKIYSMSFESDCEGGTSNSSDTVEIYFVENYKDNSYVGVSFGKSRSGYRCLKTGYYSIRFDLNQGNKTHTFYNIQVIESPSPTPYEPYISDKTEILLPEEFENGLKAIGDIKDEIVQREDGVYLIQRIGKVVLNGSENFRIASLPDANRERLYVQLKDVNGKNGSRQTLICDKFAPDKGGWAQAPHGTVTTSHEDLFQIGFTFNMGSYTVESFKEWLNKNNTTVYYELAEPKEHKLLDISNINLNTYNGVTHITSNNKIKPIQDFKVLLDKNKELTTLRVNNDILEKENTQLKVRTTSLEAENVELKNTNDTQDMLIDTTMLAADEMYSMIEAMSDQTTTFTLNTNGIINFYVAMIKRGLKDIEDVPEKYKEDVKEKM